jgi:hypothetical protein
MRTLLLAAAVALGLAAPAGCSGEDDGGTRVAGASTTASGGSSGSGQLGCEVCQLIELGCEIPAGHFGSATITAQTAGGCSGAISSDDETAPIWVHCDTATICVEHEDECFAATLTPTSFSYEIPDKYEITCTGK